MSLIDDKYALLGGPAGFLGQPQTPELVTPNGLGSYRHYEHGSIYWKHVFPEAFEIYGLIRAKWAALGWENSFLRFPMTGERPVGSGRGRANDFEGGVIAWTNLTGANEVHGLIVQRWKALGREDGLGFPLTDETATPDGRGRFNHFENGSIYWTPMTGAHEVKDDIKVAWAAAGWEQGPLGYPIDSPNQMQPATTPTNFQDFEHGALYDWLGNSRTVVRNPSIVALAGTMIDWAQIGTLLPDGDRISVRFNGHTPNGATKLTLESGPGINWWKAISLWSPTQGDRFEAWTQDRTKSRTVSIPVAELEPSNLFLSFKKAKVLGVHTEVYWLGRADRLIGNDVTFSWLRDG
jgi:hypothetical protein